MGWSQGCLQIYLPKGSSVSLLKGTWGEAKNKGKAALRDVFKSDFIMQVSCMLPCSILYAPVWPLLPKHGLKKYSHEMSKFYYFLNLSGILRLLLSSHCPNRIDELMN